MLELNYTLSKWTPRRARTQSHIVCKGVFSESLVVLGFPSFYSCHRGNLIVPKPVLFKKPHSPFNTIKEDTGDLKGGKSNEVQLY